MLLPYQQLALEGISERMKVLEDMLEDHEFPSKSYNHKDIRDDRTARHQSLWARMGENMSVSPFAAPHVTEVLLPKDFLKPYPLPLFPIAVETWLEDFAGRKGHDINSVNTGKADWFFIRTMGKVYYDTVRKEPDVEYFGYSMFFADRAIAALFKLTWVGTDV